MEMIMANLKKKKKLSNFRFRFSVFFFFHFFAVISIIFALDWIEAAKNENKNTESSYHYDDYDEDKLAYYYDFENPKAEIMVPRIILQSSTDAHTISNLNDEFYVDDNHRPDNEDKSQLMALKSDDDYIYDRFNKDKNKFRHKVKKSKMSPLWLTTTFLSTTVLFYFMYALCARFKKNNKKNDKMKAKKKKASKLGDSGISTMRTYRNQSSPSTASLPSTVSAESRDTPPKKLQSPEAIPRKNSADTLKSTESDPGGGGGSGEEKKFKYNSDSDSDADSNKAEGAQNDEPINAKTLKSRKVSPGPVRIDEIERYRGRNEPNDQWALRRAFILRFHEKIGNKEQLLYLSHMLANVRYTGQHVHPDLGRELTYYLTELARSPPREPSSKQKTAAAKGTEKSKLENLNPKSTIKQSPPPQDLKSKLEAKSKIRSELASKLADNSRRPRVVEANQIDLNNNNNIIDKNNNNNDNNNSKDIIVSIPSSNITKRRQSLIADPMTASRIAPAKPSQINNNNNEDNKSRKAKFFSKIPIAIPSSAGVPAGPPVAGPISNSALPPPPPPPPPAPANEPPNNNNNNNNNQKQKQQIIIEIEKSNNNTPAAAVKTAITEDSTRNRISKIPIFVPDRSARNLRAQESKVLPEKIVPAPKQPPQS